MDDRAVEIGKTLPLTASQAAKFWPIYEKYEAGFDELLSSQVELLQWYTANYDRMDDTTAASFLTAQLDRDARVSAYRQKWFPEFQKALGGRLAAKFMQVERRLTLATQAQMAQQVPVLQ